MNVTADQEQPRCAYCQHYLPNDPDGFYDRVPGQRWNEEAKVVVFCDEACADKAHVEAPRPVCVGCGVLQDSEDPRVVYPGGVLCLECEGLSREEED